MTFDPGDLAHPVEECEGCAGAGCLTCGGQVSHPTLGELDVYCQCDEAPNEPHHRPITSEEFHRIAHELGYVKPDTDITYEVNCFRCSGDGGVAKTLDDGRFQVVPCPSCVSGTVQVVLAKPPEAYIVTDKADMHLPSGAIVAFTSNPVVCIYMCSEHADCLRIENGDAS